MTKTEKFKVSILTYFITYYIKTVPKINIINNFTHRCVRNTLNIIVTVNTNETNGVLLK